MRVIPVLYNPKQVAPQQYGIPSSEKPKYVVESWLKKKMAVELRLSKSVSNRMLETVHRPDYVAGVLSLQRENGFGTTSKEVAESLPYTVGSMYEAAIEALRNGRVACSPTSGFHHASYEKGRGFCTFNGLMATAVRAIEVGGVRRVGILDLDAHYGDGTEDIIETLGTEDLVLTYTRGAKGYRPGDTFAALREAIVHTLGEWQKSNVDLVLYQAGADAHQNDPLGGYYSSAELLSRDATVFNTCKRLKMPVAWNLAGGYQESLMATTPAERMRPVLDIHDATMEACIRTYIDRK